MRVDLADASPGSFQRANGSSSMQLGEDIRGADVAVWRRVDLAEFFVQLSD